MAKSKKVTEGAIFVLFAILGGVEIAKKNHPESEAAQPHFDLLIEKELIVVIKEEYRLTTKAEAYIKALLKVKLPVQKWV